MDLSRREFMLVGTTSMLALDGDLQRQLDTQESGTEYDYHGVADLLGPEAARPEPGGGFFEDKLAGAYRYEATDTGARYFIQQGWSEWTPIMNLPETQVDEVRTENYVSFFDHTFARPGAPDDKNWIYDPTAVTKDGSEVALDATASMETTQHGNYPPGTEAIAGGAFRVTGTPSAGDARAGYFNATTGFGAGEDATDSFLFIRKGGTDHVVHREDWNGHVPPGRVWVSDAPVVTRFPHLFYGGGSVKCRALLHDGARTRLRTLHTFTPENTPDGWPDGPPFGQPNLPWTFASNGLSGGTVRANAAHYEFGEGNAETRVNGEHFWGVSIPTTDWVPLLSWRKRPGWEMVNVKPLKVATAATSADIKLELQLDPVLSGTAFSLPTHTTSDETAVEVTRQGDQGGIDTDGERRWTGFAPAGQGNKSGSAVAEQLTFNLPSNQPVTLAAQAIGSSATASGVVEWQEFF